MASGDCEPRAVFHSSVGRAKDNLYKVDSGGKDVYVGNAAEVLRGILNLNKPIERGVVRS